MVSLAQAGLRSNQGCSWGRYWLSNPIIILVAGRHGAGALQGNTLRL